jgi:hypothetical protein
MLQDEAEAELLEGLVVEAERHRLGVQLGQRIGVKGRNPRVHDGDRIEILVEAPDIAEADGKAFGELVVGAEIVDVVGLADEGRADDVNSNALHLEVIVTGGDAVGGVQRELEGAAVGVGGAEAERVAAILEAGELRAGEVDERTAGLELDGQRGVLAVFEGQAGGDEPARSGLLDRAGVEIVGHFQVGGRVEEEVTVIADLHERRGRDPVSALDEGRDGEGRSSEEEAGHGGVLWGWPRDR